MVRMEKHFLHAFAIFQFLKTIPFYGYGTKMNKEGFMPVQTRIQLDQESCELVKKA